MWASRPWSTASSGGGRPSSRSDPGVTRDRKELDAEWGGRPFTVVDTGGWLSGGDPLDAQVSAQAERAVAEADVVLLVVDVTVGRHRGGHGGGPVPQAVRAARCGWWSTRSTRPSARPTPGRPSPSGSATPWPVSALHGRGTGDLLDEVVTAASRRPTAGEPAAAPRPEPGRGRAPTAGRPRRHGRPAGGPGRPAQRGQVDALQPAGRRRARGDPRHPRHHPRRHRHRGRDAGGNGVLRGHRRHAAEVPHRAGHRVLLGAPGPRGPRPGRHRPAGHRRHRRA